MLRLALLCLVLSLPACQSGPSNVGRGDDGQLLVGRAQASETEERGVVLGRRTLVLDSYTGTIKLIGTDENTVRLTVERLARGATEASARERLEDVKIEEAGDGEIYQFVAVSKGDEGTEVNMTAYVPRSANVNVKLDRGAIQLSGIEGNVDVENQNGTVQAAGLAGKTVVLHTELGTIDAGFSRLQPEGSYTFTTQNGNIALVVPESASARVRVETETGNVGAGDLTFASEKLDQTAAGTRFVGQLGGGGAEIIIETGVGNVALREGVSRRLPSIDEAPEEMIDPKDMPGVELPEVEDVRDLPVAPVPADRVGPGTRGRPQS